MQDSTQNPKFIVGLTGGIGSGKSTVSELFHDQGIQVIDADTIARDLVIPDTSCFKAIVEHFGEDVLETTGTLNRTYLRELIFNDDNQRKWLESLLHPAIRKEIDHQISEIESTYIILSVPLLIESDQYDFVDRVLVIDVPKNIQIARIKIRDANTEELIQEIIASQVSREMRLNRADDIIDNSGSQHTLRQKVLVLHEHYLQIANR